MSSFWQASLARISDAELQANLLRMGEGLIRNCVARILLLAHNQYLYIAELTGARAALPKAVL